MARNMYTIHSFTYIVSIYIDCIWAILRKTGQNYDIEGKKLKCEF